MMCQVLKKDSELVFVYLYLIVNCKYKQGICFPELPNFNCHLCGHSYEDIWQKKVPSNGSDGGAMRLETQEGGGAVVESAVVEEAILSANKVGVLRN